MILGTAAQLRHEAVVAFAHAFVIAALNRQVHDRDSRWVADSLADVVTALRTAEAVGVDLPLMLQCSDDRLHHDGESLDGPSLQARSLLRRCAERGVAMLAFRRGLDAAEVNRLLDLLLLRRNVDAPDALQPRRGADRAGHPQRRHHAAQRRRSGQPARRDRSRS